MFTINCHLLPKCAFREEFVNHLNVKTAFTFSKITEIRHEDVYQRLNYIQILARNSQGG